MTGVSLTLSLLLRLLAYLLKTHAYDLALIPTLVEYLKPSRSARVKVT